MSYPLKVNETLPVADRVREPSELPVPVRILQKPFVSLGYDYIRVQKAFHEKDVQQLRRDCTLYRDKSRPKDQPKWHFNNEPKIAFEMGADRSVFRGAKSSPEKQQIFLCVCPAKLLHNENVILSSPEEWQTALHTIQRLTGFDFSDGIVCELHITATIQTPLPFAFYRSLIHAPKQYTKEEKDGNDYYNSKRLTMLIYDKASNCKGKFSERVQNQFSETFTPELFRVELRLNKHVRQTLGEKYFDKEFLLASDLIDPKTFLSIVQKLIDTLNRFMKKIKNPFPEKLSVYDCGKLFVITEECYAIVKKYYEGRALTKSDKRDFAIATKYHNEAKEYERSKYLQDQLSEKISSLIAEYSTTPELPEQAKMTLARSGRGKILSLPAKGNRFVNSSQHVT